MPLGPFVWVMSVLCAVTAAIHLLLMVKPVDGASVGGG